MSSFQSEVRRARFSGTGFGHPCVGRAKVEDGAMVTRNGLEGLGDLGRQWTIVEG